MQFPSIKQQFPSDFARELSQEAADMRHFSRMRIGKIASKREFALLIPVSSAETGSRNLHAPPPSLPKPATDSSLAEKPFLRPFLARGGLRFPVSARRHRLQAPFGAPVSGGKNPVPNSKRAGLSRPSAKSRRHLSRRETCHNELSVRFRLYEERGS